MLALARAVMSGLKPPTYGEGASSGQRYFVGRSFSSDDAGFGGGCILGLKPPISDFEDGRSHIAG